MSSCFGKEISDENINCLNCRVWNSCLNQCRNKKPSREIMIFAIKENGTWRDTYYFKDKGGR